MFKSIPAWPRAVTTLCLGWLVAGCAETGTTVVSRSRASTAPVQPRIMVVSQLAWADKTWAEAFEKAMSSELRKAGALSSIQTRDPLSLQADKVKYAAQIGEFKPDLVLVVEAGDGTADEQGRNLKRNFEAGLFKHYTERNLRELTWRARVMLEPAGTHITPTDMPALARDLVGRLQADGILSKPKRSVVAPLSRPIISPYSR
jgi:hypothetical protein